MNKNTGNACTQFCTQLVNFTSFENRKPNTHYPCLGIPTQVWIRKKTSLRAATRASQAAPHLTCFKNCSSHRFPWITKQHTDSHTHSCEWGWVFKQEGMGTKKGSNYQLLFFSPKLVKILHSMLIQMQNLIIIVFLTHPPCSHNMITQNLPSYSSDNGTRIRCFSGMTASFRSRWLWTNSQGAVIIEKIMIKGKKKRCSRAMHVCCVIDHQHRNYDKS